MGALGNLEKKLTIIPTTYGSSHFVFVQNCIIAMFINCSAELACYWSSGAQSFHTYLSDIVADLIIQPSIGEIITPTYFHIKHFPCLGLVIKDTALILVCIESLLELNLCPRSASGWNVYALHLIDCNSNFVKDETCPLFLIQEGSPTSFSSGFDFDLQISMFVGLGFLYDLFVASDPLLKISFCHRHLGTFPWYYVPAWSQKEQYQIKDTTEIGPLLEWIMVSTPPSCCWLDSQQLFAYVSNFSHAPSACNRSAIVTWRPSL